AATAALAEADRAQIATAVTASQLGVIQKSIVGALTDMDRLDEAAAQLQAHERFVAERHMPVSWQIGAHRVHAELAMAQRDAASAEKHLRAALAVNAGLNRPLVRSTVEMTAQLAVTLWAQSRAAEAVPLLAALDARLATQPGLKDAASLPFERGLVQLATGQADSAVGRFKSVTDTQLKLRGEGHYYHAQAEGLLGVAQWRSGKPELREQALDHLRSASVRLLSPTHPNVQLNRGLRPQLTSSSTAACARSCAS
uniref:hypothetical protein n=1 Tax=Aquabacterium sp. TaxID=1872578 RepID=UPI00378390B0